MSDLHFICSMKQIGFHRPLHHLRSRVAVRSELPASWMALWNGSPWGRCKSGQPLSWWGGARPSFSHEGPSSQLNVQTAVFWGVKSGFSGERAKSTEFLGCTTALLCFSGRWPGRLEEGCHEGPPRKDPWHPLAQSSYVVLSLAACWQVVKPFAKLQPDERCFMATMICTKHFF